jgi:hypothetical protein
MRNAPLELTHAMQRRLNDATDMPSSTLLDVPMNRVLLQLVVPACLFAVQPSWASQPGFHLQVIPAIVYKVVERQEWMTGLLAKIKGVNYRILPETPVASPMRMFTVPEAFDPSLLLAPPPGAGD